MFNRTDTTFRQIKMGMVAYLGVVIIICLTKQTCRDMSTGQFGYGGVPGCCVDPAGGHQMSSHFNVSQVSRQIYIETMHAT